MRPVPKVRGGQGETEKVICRGQAARKAQLRSILVIVPSWCATNGMAR
jgi:hypothetical protein